MSRIAILADIQAAPAATHAKLQAVQQQLGTVPNLFRLIANSPAALEGYLGLSGALAKGRLPAATRERLALAISQFNGCGYCLAAHSFLGSHHAKLDDVEIATNRHGHSADTKADAALRFALAVAAQRGHVADADLTEVRAAGYDDAQIIEIVLHVALNVLTNYVNEVAATDIDFPVAAQLQAA